MNSQFWAKLLNIKTEPEIREEVSREPHIQHAEKVIKIGERVLRELETLEKRERENRRW